MLNKLLKRCMPWMDKGRWYSIRVVGTDLTNFRTVFNSNEILSAEIETADELSVRVTTKHVAHIIDFKYCPENNLSFIVIPSIGIDFSADNIFMLPFKGPGTYWFFMRPAPLATEGN